MRPQSSTTRKIVLLKLSALLVLLVCLSSVEGRWTRGAVDKAEADRLLKKMLKAVEQVNDFFASDYSGINVDGLFGIRISQGQIIEAVRECKRGGSCPAQLLSRLQALSEDIDVTGTTALDYVENRDPAYFQQFLPTINKPYIVRYTPVTWTDLDTTQLVGEDNNYNETAGDLCYSRIFGTFREDGKALPRCNVTGSCWAMMTKPDTSGYTITHQLLYFILSEKAGCVEVMEQAMQSDIREAEDRLCRAIYNEAAKEVKDGTVSDRYQDIFFEQVVLCGILGFENFLRTDWMRMALTWQKSNGCFSFDVNGDTMEEETDQSKPELKEEESLLMRDLQREAQMIENRHHGRRLLRDSVMSDGCSAHKTGLAFGTLGLYTRYLARQLYLNQ